MQDSTKRSANTKKHFVESAEGSSSLGDVNGSIKPQRTAHFGANF